MSSGFDDRVEARLIGLRMAADGSNGLATNVGESSNEISDLQETNNQNSLTNQRSLSPVFTNHSSNNNAPITARR